jgi:hypothetical protein
MSDSKFSKHLNERIEEIEIFHFLPNIRELHLAQNHLPKDDNILRRMFEHLTNLRKINLHSTLLYLETIFDHRYTNKG